MSVVTAISSRLSPTCFAYSNLGCALRVPQRRCCSRSHSRLLTCGHPAFDAAVASGVVVDRGSSVPVDQFGFLDRSSLPERVVAQDWRMLVDFTVQTILSSLTLDARRAVHAIYLRGSVASGYAIPGESDIDFAIYVDPPFVETLKAKRICTSQAVCSRFKDVVRVDYRVYPFKLRAIPSPAPSLSELSGALVIQAFGICVYGYDFLADSPACRVDCHLAVDIMRDKRVAVAEARRLGSCRDGRGELRVLQWFLKRAIRALAELYSIESGRFARDLVPCYNISLTGGARWADFLTEALILACQAPTIVCDTILSNRKDRLHGNIFTASYTCCDNLAVIVEDEYLRRVFPIPDASALIASDVPLILRPVHSRGRHLQSTLDMIGEARSFLKLAWDRKFGVRGPQLRESSIPNSSHVDKPRQDRLPVVCVDTPRQPNCKDYSHAKGVPDIEICLNAESEPILYRNLGSTNSAVQASAHRHAFHQLMDSRRLVDVRVSPNNHFVFCRLSHPLILDRKFSPPSISVRVTEAEFAMRCSERHAQAKSVAPLCYPGGSERLYLQSEVPLSECIVQGLAMRSSNISITQNERVWVSCAGTVSSLHFDISASLLIQVSGRKRMLLFPPEMISFLGIYPVGHPLHRRSRVDLTKICRANHELFQEFWQRASTSAVQVLLEPGDILSFPSGWAHYTESLTYSVSHSFRWAPIHKI